jgi:hypothetical protein
MPITGHQKKSLFLLRETQPLNSVQLCGLKNFLFFDRLERTIPVKTKK